MSERVYEKCPGTYAPRSYSTAESWCFACHSWQPTYQNRVLAPHLRRVLPDAERIEQEDALYDRDAGLGMDR